jgi:nitroreductase
MDVETAIRTRRSIKAFDPSHRLDEGEAARLIELATLSPTAFNLQHWRFVVVRDPLVRFQLRQAAYGQPQVTDASLLIALCADVKAWDRDPERCWRNVDPTERDRIAGTIRRFYAPDAQLQRDEAMRSCGLAAQTLMLAATALGHGSCPMDGFDFAAVARILNLPPDHLVSMFVAIGRALDPAGPRPGTIPAAELTAVDRFTKGD